MGSGGVKPRPTGSGPETRFSASQLGLGHLLLDEDSTRLQVYSLEGLVFEMTIP